MVFIHLNNIYYNVFIIIIVIKILIILLIGVVFQKNVSTMMNAQVKSMDIHVVKSVMYS